MKVNIKTEEGHNLEFENYIIRITDKQGKVYRIKDDNEQGIEIMSECGGKICIEPSVSNVIVIHTKNY